MPLDRKKPRGRPATLTMPERIPDTAENIARALLRAPPRKADEWDYVKSTADQKRTRVAPQ